MAVILGLVNLYNEVRKELQQRIPGVQFRFGKRAPAQQNTTSYALLDWVPGDPAGTAGKDLPARDLSQNPRNVADLDELFTVYMRAYDATALVSSEDYAIKQYTVTRLLYDDWRAAVYRAAFGTVWIDGLRWNFEKVEFALGAQLIATCRIRVPIPDDPAVEVSPVGALLTLTSGTTPETPIEVIP